MMEKLTKERYESIIDRAITWYENIAETCSMLTRGNVSHIAAALRGKAIRAAEWLTKMLKTSSVNGISIAEQDGEKGVRLCVGDVDIFIEAQDLDVDVEFDWDEAMDRLKEIGKQTFSKKQGYLIAAYKEEINKLLEEIGGDTLASYYWSSTESSSSIAWFVNFGSGNVGKLSKSNCNVVRPCKEFKS